MKLNVKCSLLALLSVLTFAPLPNVNAAGWLPLAGGGGGSASFTFGTNLGFTTQGTSPYVVSGTFNTGASNIPVVAIVQANDFSSGVITGVSIAGTGALTCIQGTNNANEEAWLCYGPPTALTTANISITFTGTNIQICIATGKISTTTPTPYSTGNSTVTQAGATPPLIVAATTGAGGIPANGVSVGVIGDFFSSARTITSVTPIQDAISNDLGGNGEALALGHSTTAGSTNGITVNDSAGSIFPAWAVISWSP